MQIESSIVIFENAGAPQQKFLSVSGGELLVQMSGNGTATLVIEGKSHAAVGDWTPLAAIDMTDYSVSEEITRSGIFAVSTVGISCLRASLTAVSGGAVTVTGKGA